MWKTLGSKSAFKKFSWFQWLPPSHSQGSNYSPDLKKDQNITAKGCPKEVRSQGLGVVTCEMCAADLHQVKSLNLRQHSVAWLLRKITLTQMCSELKQSFWKTVIFENNCSELKQWCAFGEQSFGKAVHLLKKQPLVSLSGCQGTSATALQEISTAALQVSEAYFFDGGIGPNLSFKTLQLYQYLIITTDGLLC